MTLNDLIALCMCASTPCNAFSDSVWRTLNVIYAHPPAHHTAGNYAKDFDVNGFRKVFEGAHFGQRGFRKSCCSRLRKRSAFQMWGLQDVP